MDGQKGRHVVHKCSLSEHRVEVEWQIDQRGEKEQRERLRLRERQIAELTHLRVLRQQMKKKG